MIKLSSRPACPPVLKSKAVKKARKSLRDKVRAGKWLTDKDFVGKSYWTLAKATLHEHQNGKCCFCERYRDRDGSSDVEHFRPKLKIIEQLDQNGYWWLAYKWENLFFSCKMCNSQGHKGNQFPLLPGGLRARTHKDDLSAEKPALINPCEDPDLCIDYDWESSPGKVLILGIDAGKRGETTIGILGLDIRDDLIEKRADIVRSLQAAEKLLQDYAVGTSGYQRGIDLLRHKARPESEYLGLVRCYIRRRGLQEYVR